jgi:uncharacterized protein (TIGR02598 family)
MKPGGFSLVESVLALGIIGTVLVAAIGILPQALNTSEQSYQRMVRALIFAHLQSQSSTSDSATDLFFDSAGTPQPTRAASTAYIGRTTKPVKASLPGSTKVSLNAAKLELSSTDGRWQDHRTVLLPP